MQTETVNIPSVSVWDHHGQPIAVADKFLVQGSDKHKHIYLAVGQTPISRFPGSASDGNPPEPDPIHTIAVFALTPEGVQDLLEVLTKATAKMGVTPEEGATQ